jgi:hypothetical protein
VRRAEEAGAAAVLIFDSQEGPLVKMVAEGEGGREGGAEGGGEVGIPAVS